MKDRRSERVTEGAVYRCSDGRQYTGVEIWERFESGAWTPCCWDTRTGCEWVGTRDDDLLTLWPVSTTVPDDGDR